MDNYKIHRIHIKNSEASVEVQNLLINAGLKWNISKEPRVEHPYGYPIALYIRWQEKEYFCGYDSYAENINLDELRQLVTAAPIQDQGLISGAEALKALLAGENVHYSGYGEQDWDTALNCNIGVFLKHEKFPDFSFKIVPRVIKLELEIPAPYKAKIGGRDDTSFVLNVGRHQYLYQNEDDYTKARNALEAVFDAALGGNNS